MTAAHTYVTTTIPYVNARPHIGFALELVQADVLARFRRARGDRVRFQAGTDDNSLKNVLAAEAAGTPVREFVDRNAEAFLALGEELSLTVDDIIRTSRDPRHRPGVERLWRACARAGDLYRRRYDGLYCTGCEQFYVPAELPGGRCPEHETAPQQVTEENWFFRLSRYAGPLRTAITEGRLRIEPAGRRNEVLAFIDRGLADFSVSRPAAGPAAGAFPYPMIRTRSFTYGSTPCATTSPRSATRRTATPTGGGGQAPDAVFTCSARACSDSTPCTGRPCCSRRASRCRPISSCTTT